MPSRKHSTSPLPVGKCFYKLSIMILWNVLLLLVCFVVCVLLGVFVCFLHIAKCRRWGLSEIEQKLTWSIFQHKIIVTMLANENLYTRVKETDILLHLNMSLLFFFLLFCSETVKKELWDCTQGNKNNQEPKAQLTCFSC